MASVVFKCPQCGAPFEFNEGDRVAICSFCKMVSAVVGDVGVNRLVIPHRIDQHAALSSVRKLLASFAGENYAASFSVVSSELLFLPFWRIKGMALGWQWHQSEVFREEVEYDENGARITKKVRQPDEKKFSPMAKPVDVTMPAGDFRLFGAIRSGIAATVQKSEVMDFETVSAMGTIIDPLKGLAHAKQEVIAMLLSGMHKNAAVKSEARIHIANEWHSILYYPVWNMVFRRNGIIYPVSVDGICGDVTRCRFPGKFNKSPFLPLALIALILFGLTTAPLLGVASFVICWFFLAKRYGHVDLHTIITCIIDEGKRETGVERG